MKVDRDILLGQIAIERGLITEAQLEECLQGRALSDQSADPLETISPGKVSRPLGIILLSKNYVKEEELIGLIEEQNRRFRALEEYRKMVKVDLLLGELLIKYNKTTQLQINKCIEIQEAMVTKGTSPIPRLGELLLEHGYTNKETIQEMLKIQNKEVLICTRCGKQFNVVGIQSGVAYRCKSCGGIMVTQDSLSTLKADETHFESEVKEEIPPPEEDGKTP